MLPLSPGPRAIVEKSEKFKILKVLRMGLPIVENLSGLSGNILAYLEFTNSISIKNQKKYIELY